VYYLLYTNTVRLLGRAADEPGMAKVFQGWQESGSPVDTVGAAT